MTSKLFHTVVGVGIALGTAACGGATTDEFIEPFAADAGTGGVTASGGAAGSAAGAAGATTGGAGGGAGSAGAGGSAGVGGSGGAGSGGVAGAAGQDAGAAGAPPIDAGSDAVVNAFCDNPWPITKSGRAVCGPYEACQLGEAPWCFAPDGQGSCTITPLQCSDGKWQCMGAATPVNQPQPPFECP